MQTVTSDWSQLLSVYLKTCPQATYKPDWRKN